MQIWRSRAQISNQNVDFKYYVRYNAVQGSDQMTTTKSERIDVRVSPEQKKRIEQAASLVGLSVSAFLTTSADRAAKAAIEESTHMDLLGEDSEIFFEALINPPEPTTSLKKAAKQYKRTITTKS